MLEAITEQALDSIRTLTGSLTLPENRIYWGYLLSSLALAVPAVYWFHARGNGARTGPIRAVFAFIFDRKVWLHRSAIVDYLCFSINAVIAFVLRLGTVAGGALAGGLSYLVLVLVSGQMNLSVAPHIWTLGAFTLFSLVLFDFASFYAHYLLHRIPLLWEFHKVHHSAQVLTPITVYRIHPGEILLLNFARGIALGITSSTSLFLFGEHTDPLQIFGLNVGVFLFYVLGANLRHSHVWLPYPRWLSHIFISPAQHQVHHSSLPQHHDANFGVMFAFWDWLYGSLYIPKEREHLVFGLHEGEDAEYQTVKNFYLVPLQKAWRRIRGTADGATAAADQPAGSDARSR